MKHPITHQHHSHAILISILLITLPSLHAYAPTFLVGHLGIKGVFSSCIASKRTPNDGIKIKTLLHNNNREVEEKFESWINDNFQKDKGISAKVNRRDVLNLSVTTAATSMSLLNPSFALALADVDSTITSKSNSGSTTALLSNYNPLDYTIRPELGRSIFPPPFIPPLQNRATFRYSIGRNTWRLEQLLALTNVTATISTNVVKLQDGSLWVHGPLWPTGEYCSLLDELGTVKHVVLPVNALEHKAPLQAFLKRYSDATVWIAPGQYGPFGSSGSITTNDTLTQIQTIVKKAKKTMNCRIDGILPIGNSKNAMEYMLPPWSNEFDIYTLYADLTQNAGPVSECAFIHKVTNTLFVSDAVICAQDRSTIPIPPIFQTYFHNDSATLDDSTFWPRTVLQAVFLPLRQDSKGQYPGYNALTNRVTRAPILRAFADARAPNTVRDWVTDITNKSNNNGFDRIVTAHFASPIQAGPKLFSQPFAHLDTSPSTTASSSSTLPPIECQDWSTLDALNDFIESNKLGAPVIFDYKADCKNYN